MTPFKSLPSQTFFSNLKLLIFLSICVSILSQETETETVVEDPTESNIHPPRSLWLWGFPFPSNSKSFLSGKLPLINIVRILTLKPWSTFLLQNGLLFRKNTLPFSLAITTNFSFTSITCRKVSWSSFNKSQGTLHGSSGPQHLDYDSLFFYFGFTLYFYFQHLLHLLSKKGRYEPKKMQNPIWFPLVLHPG